MRVLVTWGSKHGGTEGIARMLAETLQQRGFEVVAVPAHEVTGVDGFDAAIVGGSLYANRWVASARKLVQRHALALRKIPVWLFSSGPLDDSADHQEVPPPREVAVLGERIGAVGHVTFGGRLAPDVEGFPAAAMAKTNAGDWRNPQRIRAWALALAEALPHAVPHAAIDHPGRAWPRWLAHGILGGVVVAATMAALLTVAGTSLAIAVHAVLAPLGFVAIAWHYFRARGARAGLPTALLWTAMVSLVDVVALATMGRLAMLASFAATWLPLASIFVVTWVTGAMMATMPWPRPVAARRPVPPAAA